MLHNVTISDTAVNCSSLSFIIKWNNAVWLGEREPNGDDFGAKYPGECVVLSSLVNFSFSGHNYNAGAATRAGPGWLEACTSGACFVARGGAKHREFYGSLGL